jgi:hypothetical protein
MIYKLTTRKIKEEDFDRNCKYPETDNDVLELSLNELVAHIQEIPYVLTVVRNECIFTIATDVSVEKEELLNKMEYFFSEMWCKFRYVSLDLQ